MGPHSYTKETNSSLPTVHPFLHHLRDNLNKRGNTIAYAKTMLSHPHNIFANHTIHRLYTPHIPHCDAHFLQHRHHHLKMAPCPSRPSHPSCPHNSPPPPSPTSNTSWPLSPVHPHRPRHHYPPNSPSSHASNKGGDKHSPNRAPSSLSLRSLRSALPFTVTGITA